MATRSRRSGMKLAPCAALGLAALLVAMTGCVSKFHAAIEADINCVSKGSSAKPGVFTYGEVTSGDPAWGRSVSAKEIALEIGVDDQGKQGTVYRQLLRAGGLGPGRTTMTCACETNEDLSI